MTGVSARLPFRLLILLAWIMGGTVSNAQCIVKAYSTSTELCAGDSISLYAVGGCGMKLNADFNTGFLPNDVSTSGTPDFTNPCGSGIDGTTYLWMGVNSGSPRMVTAGPFNLSFGNCQLCFDMRYAIEGGSSPCEGPNLPNEGVTLQYSVNNGLTWTDIQYWDPNGGNDSLLTSWQSYCVPLPAGASSAQTMFRWAQQATLPPVLGHWGLDNLKLLCNSNVNYLWSTGHTGQTTPWLHPSSNTVYSVTMTDLSNGQIYADTVGVKVRFTPSPNFTITTPVCKDQQCIITYTGNAGPSATFNWGFSGATTTGSGAGPYTAMWSNTGNYDITLQVSQGGCTSVTAQQQVLIEPLISFFVDHFNGCEPLTIQITDNTSPLNCTFKWDFGDPGSGAANTSTSPNPTHTFSTHGPFDLTTIVTTPGGCMDTFTAPDLINVYPKPVPDFDPVPPIAPLTNPVIQFIDNSQFTDAWLWKFGDAANTTSTITSPTHTYGEGTYTVWLIATNTFGCTDSISKEVKVLDNILTFPNVFTPNGDGVNEYFVIDNIESVIKGRLSVYNRHGQLVYLNELYDNTFDGEKLSDGVYYYVFEYSSYFEESEHSGTITILRQ